MAANIKTEHPGVDIDLVRGGGGDFIVTRTDASPTRELWNKNATGRGFPDADAILSQLEDR